MTAEVIDMTTVPTMIPLRETSRRTGISYDALRKLCITGKIAHLRVGSQGGKILVNYESLISFLNSEGLKSNDAAVPVTGKADPAHGRRLKGGRQ